MFFKIELHKEWEIEAENSKEALNIAFQEYLPNLIGYKDFKVVECITDETNDKRLK